ncbi:MAG: helix-turn-helix domain-containing protein [Gallionella sp.]
MNTQCKRLLTAMRHGPIDQMKALSKLGISRLASRCYDLKQAGHAISKRSKIVRNRFGESVRVAEYSLG